MLLYMLIFPLTLYVNLINSLTLYFNCICFSEHRPVIIAEDFNNQPNCIPHPQHFNEARAPPQHRNTTLPVSNLK